MGNAQINIFDESAISMYVQEKLQEEFNVKHGGASSSWNIRCPVCGDSKKSARKRRGHYYPRTNSYYCFNCDVSSKGLYVIAQLTDQNISDVKRDFIQWSRKDREIELVEKEEPKKKNALISINNDIIRPLPTWTDLPDKVKPIITLRKIFEAPYRPPEWKLYWDKKQKRIVIPWLKNGEIVYYQNRAVSKKQDPKYLYPEDSDKPIFGLDELDESFPYIFLLEGAFDSIWIKNGVAIGGKSLTNYQQDLLFPYIGKPVYFFDNQWVDETGHKESVKLVKENLNQPIFIWDKSIKEKDLNECAMNNKDFINKLNDICYLRSRIFKGARALLELKWRN